MRTLLPAAFASFLLSCTQYQYVTVSSEQLPKNNQQEFVAENDTLKITYRFNGDGGPITLSISNKLNEPVEIDWQKSALIRNGNATSYSSQNMQLNGLATIDTVFRQTVTLNAEIAANEFIQFIPPKASITKTLHRIAENYFTGLSSADQQKKTYQISQDVSVKYRMKQFTAQESPLVFRSYLRFKAGTGAAKEFAADHSFYVSEVWQSATAPEELPAKLTSQGNVFYLTGGQ